MLTSYFLLINVQSFVANAFIPHPAIRLGGQAGNSITHTELVQLGFIRSLTRFFLDAQIQSKSSIDVESFKAEHTIDELYQLAHPDWTNDQVKLYSYPLKSIIDKIQVRDALVDLNPSTKNLPSAHFDSESFKESNDRIIQLRNKILEDVNDPNKDLDKARGRIGDLLHTLQDFYSHSNWIEMGKTKINDRIGIHEDIGQVAGINQATCTNNGCTKIQTKCNLMQKIVLKTCPMEYYDCKNNILSDINNQGLLTSGYMSNQFNINNEPIIKPTNVEKCSHGSVMDTTSHQVAIGGINKDTMTPLYSPHYHLHFDAAKLAIDATEQFFNDLRKDLGDRKFDRLFAINPTEAQIQAAKIAIANRQQFQFLTSTPSIGLSTGDLNFEKTIKQRIQEILSILFDLKDSNVPTYDLSENGIEKTDTNIHSGSLLIDGLKTLKKRRFKGHKSRSYTN
ncbi:unnamed protein product [Adineta steineri]|uniref:VWA7 N-terminal domain-containing protein n=2 Tax=Adineta steineri TaxID=433720 RepID=A0A819LHE3_9BILA|nr:unnamed protein product [Adineta steineri]CAF3961833.1 unnamed protein product [Adineta steineri]